MEPQHTKKHLHKKGNQQNEDSISNDFPISQNLYLLMGQYHFSIFILI